MKLKRTLTAALGCLILSSPALAEDDAALALHVGAFDVFDSDTAAEFGIEYRFAPVASFYDIIPVVGVTANSDGGYWGHAGIRYDFDLGQNWALTPHFAVSLYEDGGGKDLGHPIEFRTGVELAYKLGPASHLGIGFYHLSNCRLSSTNPGQESVYLSYSFSPNF